MTNREKFIDYVKNGGEKFASPQIGCGAGFDTQMMSNEWYSETTFEDTIEVTQRFDMVPLYNLALPDAGICCDELAFKETKKVETDDTKKVIYELKSPYGNVYKEFVEHKANGITPIKFAVEEEEHLKVLEWYIERWTECDLANITKWCKEQVEKVEQKGAISFQWCMQPYELLGWPNTLNTMYLANDCTEYFYKIMDKICILNLKLFDAVVSGGADFVFLGGPGSEMISPDYYERFLVPYSKMMTEEAHKRGLLIYSHICSPIEPMLSLGYYNKFGIDCFETLSMPPVGNVKSLSDALSKLDESICIRGNIGLDSLLTCTPEQIEELCFTALRESEGRKHILAASDYLLYGIPEENVNAMCNSVKKYFGS